MQAQQSARLCSPTHFLLYFPSFFFSPPLACLAVWRCRHSTGNKDRSGTKKQGGKPSERSLLRRCCIFDCFFFSRLVCLFPPAAAAAVAADAHSQVAGIDSLSQRHDTPSAALSTTHADLTTVLSLKGFLFFFFFRTQLLF